MRQTQIVAILKEPAAGDPVNEVRRQYGMSSAILVIAHELCEGP